MKNLILSILVSFSIIQSGFAQLKIYIDNIEVDEVYKCFYYPNEIRIEMNGYDSVSFKKSSVTFFGLESEEVSTVELSNSIVNINPSCKLSAHYAAKKEPIIIKIKESYGYKGGKKVKLKDVPNELKINLESTNLLDDKEYSRINFLGRNGILLALF